jgi:hypothetical protein
VLWRRLGRIVEPRKIGDWAHSHASVPIAWRRPDESLELLFSPRDAQGRSHVARADLDLAEEGSRVRVHDEPVLEPGELGAFDDSGATATCLVRQEGREVLYYNGWNRGVTVPFTSFIGCAVSEPGGDRFHRVSRAPIVGRSDVDPFLAMSAWVLVEDGRWRMWYVSGVEWIQTRTTPRHRYRIVYAESDGPFEWEPSGHVCIDFQSEEEYAIARPVVIRDGHLYRMWFSCRGSAYRIGYAESEDGISWLRDDECGGFQASGDGWESHSVEYAFVFDHEGKRWMLYNGNGYGETGIGVALLDENG